MFVQVDQRLIDSYTKVLTIFEGYQHDLLNQIKNYKLENVCVLPKHSLCLACSMLTHILASLMGCFLNTLHLSFFSFRVERVPVTPEDSKSQFAWWFSEDT